MIRASLAGKTLVAAGEAASIERSLPHGHVAAIWAMARSLGLPALLGPACEQRDLAMALIVARVARPGSKLATTRWWADTTLAVDLGVESAGTDDVYAAMDWLVGRQASIENTLAKRHLTPGGMVMFDLSSSWVEGTCCPLAARGYSRDHKAGKAQIEYGLMTDGDGRPVAVEVFAGNTADPTAFIAAVAKVKDRFGLSGVVMVGDRGMITQARINAIRELGGLDWVSALRAPAIKKLATSGVLQLGLFDTTDLAEIAHPDFPGERLIACKNPLLADQRARKRSELLDATEALLAPIKASVDAGGLAGADKIGIRVGKIIGRHKMAKHFTVTIGDNSLSWERNHDKITAEAALDGIYVIRTSLTPDRIDPAGIVAAYKDLSKVERRLPEHQNHRLGPAPHLPPPRRPGPGARVHLHARRLPGLASPPSMGAAHLHRRNPTKTHRPRRPRPTLHRRSDQSLPRQRHPGPARPFLRRDPRPPRHTHPQHHPHRRDHHRHSRRPHRPTTPRLRTPRNPHPQPPSSSQNQQPAPQQIPCPRRGFVTSSHVTSA